MSSLKTHDDVPGISAADEHALLVEKGADADLLRVIGLRPSG